MKPVKYYHVYYVKDGEEHFEPVEAKNTRNAKEKFRDKFPEAEITDVEFDHVID